MRHILCWTVLATLLAGETSVRLGAAELSDANRAKASETGWVRLFDGKSLHGWYTKIQNKERNEDPAKFFQVHDGVIHVYKDQAEGIAVPNGYIATEAEYANYHLRMEYKWGSKKFKPRTAGRRDAGLLYHVITPDLVWPRSVECQIQEGDTGDCFTVRGTQVVTSVEMVEIETPGGVKKLPRYKPEAEGGTEKTMGDGGIARIVKAKTHEHDGWNTVEVIVRGSQSSEHIVNGHTVFRAKDLRQLSTPPSNAPPRGAGADTKKWVPLERGRIALQCEYAEVFYRNIEIRELAEGKN
jgi:hypothetical protein